MLYVIKHGAPERCIVACAARELHERVCREEQVRIVQAAEERRQWVLVRRGDRVERMRPVHVKEGVCHFQEGHGQDARRPRREEQVP